MEKAGIAFEDEQGRRADFHALRHTYGSQLAKAGVAPRVAMSLMRHTDMRLTMNVYTDPRIFDMAGAVAMLPTFDRTDRSQVAQATGTNGNTQPGRSESVSSPSAELEACKAAIGRQGDQEQPALSLVTGRDMREKNPVRQRRGELAGEGTRTLYSQRSQRCRSAASRSVTHKIWTPGIEPGQRGFQARALPTELSPRRTQSKQTPPTGLEPVTFRLTTGCSIQLSYGGSCQVFRCAGEESNLRLDLIKVLFCH